MAKSEQFLPGIEFSLRCIIVLENMLVFYMECPVAGHGFYVACILPFNSRGGLSADCETGCAVDRQPG